MKQYVAALRYKVKSIAVSQKRMKELMKEEILSEQTLQDNENVTVSVGLHFQNVHWVPIHFHTFGFKHHFYGNNNVI